MMVIAVFAWQIANYYQRIRFKAIFPESNPLEHLLGLQQD